MNNTLIGQILLRMGAITEDMLEKALLLQKKEHNKKRIGEILREMGCVTERQVLTALSERLALPFVDLANYRVKPSTIRRIPLQLATRYQLIALEEKDGQLTIAMNDPLDFYAQEAIRQVTNMPLIVTIATSDDISHAIEYYYAELSSKQAAHSAVKHTHTAVKPSQTQNAEIRTDKSAPIVQLVNSLLLRGYSANASDIHIEPFEKQTRVRLRIDGMMIQYMKLAASLHASIVARIKILAGLDIAEKRAPQDGHFRIQLEGNELNLRVSVVPTVFGEKAVLRFLSSRIDIDNANQFGMNDANYRKLLQMLRAPHGIIYLTGPTGSGKTTTLYAALSYLSSQPVNISTIEDPVERNLPGVSQMQVNPPAGVTFESGLRALLRQDPNILMVGETRDSETAFISVRAAITGHLVLSTLHTNDAASSILRLKDMGTPPYLVASALTGIVAQRLLRKVCPHCAETYTPDEAEQSALGVRLETATRGRGCPQCNGTGYRGRIAIHETLLIDHTLRRMITENASTEAIQAHAVQAQHMQTLREGAIALAREGTTSTEEVIKLLFFTE